MFFSIQQIIGKRMFFSIQQIIGKRIFSSIQQITGKTYVFFNPTNYRENVCFFQSNKL